MAADIPEYDDLVIGSSPLMLLQANFLASQGQKVCVVDRMSVQGGLWSPVELKDGDVTDRAVHILENYAGVYECLESLTGCEFVALDEPPVRLLGNGWVIPYDNRLIRSATRLYLTLGWLRASLKVAAGNQASKESQINFQSKLADHFRIRVFQRNSEIKGPRQGYAVLISRIVERLETLGVCFATSDIAAVSFAENGKWLVEGSQMFKALTSRVHCTTTSNLRSVSPGRIESIKISPAERFAFIVEIPKSRIKRRRSYVALWKHPSISRINRLTVDSLNDHERYIVEIHGQPSDFAGNLSEAIGDSLIRSSIVRSKSDFHLVSEVSCRYLRYVDQWKDEEVATGFITYKSSGNLAAAISRWLELEDRGSLLERHS